LDDAADVRRKNELGACYIFGVRWSLLVFTWLTAACSASDRAAAEASDGTVSSADTEVARDTAVQVDSNVFDGSADTTSEAGSAPCRFVAHVGDSLTAQTLEPMRTAYVDAGATAQLDAYGGRAILQKLPADPKTGKQAALDLVKSGFNGCWVVALGTNDTANVAAGASYTRAQAIDEMMKAIDPGAKAPVMWVNTFTTKTTGSWANDNMRLWNEALSKALARWPNLKVFDWASLAAKGVAPFSDGIHHTTAGYAVRNKAIAEAYVGMFPVK